MMWLRHASSAAPPGLCGVRLASAIRRPRTPPPNGRSEPLDAVVRLKQERVRGT